MELIFKNLKESFANYLKLDDVPNASDTIKLVINLDKGLISCYVNTTTRDVIKRINVNIEDVCDGFEGAENGIFKIATIKRKEMITAYDAIKGSDDNAEVLMVLNINERNEASKIIFKVDPKTSKSKLKVAFECGIVTQLEAFNIIINDEAIEKLVEDTLEDNVINRITLDSKKFNSIKKLMSFKKSESMVFAFSNDGVEVSEYYINDNELISALGERDVKKYMGLEKNYSIYLNKDYNYNIDELAVFEKNIFSSMEIDDVVITTKEGMGFFDITKDDIFKIRYVIAKKIIN